LSSSGSRTKRHRRYAHHLLQHSCKLSLIHLLLFSCCCLSHTCHCVHPSPRTIRTRATLNLSFKRSSHKDSLLYTQFTRIHLSFISSSIHCRAHLSLYLNISM
jgi:hypothetical protein